MFEMQSKSSNGIRGVCLRKFLQRFVLLIVLVGVIVLTQMPTPVPPSDSLSALQNNLESSSTTAHAPLLDDDEPPPEFRKLIYVRNAFRVSDDRIRLTVVKSVLNEEPLFFLYGTQFGRVELACHLSQCPDAFSPPCELNGYVGSVHGLSANDSGDVLWLRTSQGQRHSVPVLDVRPEAVGGPQHELGVCVQPIYLMTDYSLFVQFFEYWLAEGASKFLLYWESMSPEVRDMLAFYVATTHAHIELVPWSQLPVSPRGHSAPAHNPNAFWFRLEVFMAIFDCMHRARHSVRFVAQTDLDEMFFVSSGKPLLSFLRLQNRRHPNMASLLFQSKRAHMQTPFSNSSHPSAHSFAGFRHFHVDREPFPRPLYVKMIHRPERNIHVHIHRPLTPEQRLPGVFYEHVPVSSEEAVVWHFRRLRDHYPVRNTAPASMATRADLFAANYARRLRMAPFDRSHWHNEGATLGRQLDLCRQRLSTQRLHVCHSLFACESILSTVTPIRWVRAKNTWAVVGG